MPRSDTGPRSRPSRRGRIPTHRGSRAQEHEVEEALDRVAHAWVVLAAVLLREPFPEVLSVQDRVQVVLEQVALDVEDEFLSTDGLVGDLGLGGRLGGDRVPATR